MLIFNSYAKLPESILFVTFVFGCPIKECACCGGEVASWSEAGHGSLNDAALAVSAFQPKSDFDEQTRDFTDLTNQNLTHLIHKQS